MDTLTNWLASQGYHGNTVISIQQLLNLLRSFLRKHSQIKLNVQLVEEVWAYVAQEDQRTMKVSTFLEGADKLGKIKQLTGLDSQLVKQDPQHLQQQTEDRRNYQLNQSQVRPLNATVFSSLDPQSSNGSLLGQKSQNKQTKRNKIGGIKKQRKVLQQSGITQQLLDEQEKNQITGKHNKSSSLLKQLRPFYIAIIPFLIGMLLLILTFVIQGVLKSQALDKVILSKDNQDIWAHFPGKTKTQIDRNWTFFNITNAEEMLLYNQKPKFREIQDFKIIQLEDYLNITYSEDGDRVTMIDWLHFGQQPQSRNLEEKVNILNLGGLGYWYNLKIARPSVILQQGLGLLFNTIQNSIIQNIYAQAINTLYLNDFESAYANIFSNAQISKDQAFFLWKDIAYGLGFQDNLKYWIEALSSPQQIKNDSLPDMALYLGNYFTLSDSQLDSILKAFQNYKDSIDSLVLSNNYCDGVQQCTGRYLSYMQMATSFVTKNPPAGTPITPTDSICQSNVTCAGFYPEITAFYQKIYIPRNPNANTSLSFAPQLMKNWVNYNKSQNPQLSYNTAQNCLFHIGNLDALWENGTLHDQIKNNYGVIHQGRTEIQENPQINDEDNQKSVIPEKYLENIRRRFELPTLQHAMVFWEWVKYLTHELIMQNQTNEELGVGNLFANGLYKSFSYLQDNLQNYLLTSLIQKQIQTSPHTDCITFIQTSFQIQNNKTASAICDQYGQKINKNLIEDLFMICRKRFGSEWKQFKTKHNLLLSNFQNLCDPEQEKGTFGNMLHLKKIYLDSLYQCKTTPKNYCSDFQLAAIQWSTSKVTLNPPKQLSLSASDSFASWNNQMSKFEYGYYVRKYPDQQFPSISIQQAYKLLTFDSWFSATISLKTYISQETNEKLKDYMRYVGIVSGLGGLTTERTARQLIFGYQDELLLSVKQAYPPFGGDPSTPSLIAFNDPNITKDQATMELEWNTGKVNHHLLGQYRKINGKTYLNIPKESFNGNETRVDFISPWAENDYFYGTSAKQFSPNQFQNGNISLYIPNLQRYGSGTAQETYPYERFGYDLQIGYLGEYIYLSTEESDINKKYYQTFRAVFNETSVVGLPLFVCKNHFMNTTSNWSKLVDIYNQDQTIKYQQVSHWDDSFVIVEPYTGVAFQAAIYLQSNYYHKPDQLLNFYNQSLLPVFSLYRCGNLTQDAVDDLFSPLKVGLAVKLWTRIISIIILAGSCTLGGFLLYRKKIQQRSSSDSGVVSKNSNLGISLQKVQDHKNSLQRQN